MASALNPFLSCRCPSGHPRALALTYGGVLQCAVCGSAVEIDRRQSKKELATYLMSRIGERLDMHRENLHGWTGGGYLKSSEPDPEEQTRIIRELKAAILEDEKILDLLTDF